MLPNRGALLEALPKGGIVAELGVAEGDFSEQILRRVKPARLHLVDAWDSDRYLPGYDRVRERFAAEIASGQVAVHRGYSTDVVSRFDDASFDFIYIDTTHMYDLTLDELRLAAAKVKPDGCIGGHDFTAGDLIRPLMYGVIQAVNQFCRESGWRYRYLTLETHAHFSFCLEKIQ
ncbi:MAG: class I SAM-dependent methyltransferase [Planctomycetia bacterium]|nr:class I SAM-dependent methyltransferase [Planctomycetia bacterium]